MVGFNTAGTIANDVLGFFGVRGAGIGVAIDSLLGNPQGVLLNMQDAYLEMALGHGTGPIQRMMGNAQMSMMPWMMPFGMPSPMAMMPGMMPFAGAGYAGAQEIDLAPGSWNIPILSKLFSGRRRAAGRFERMLRTNPHARAAFEAQIGGRITNFGVRNDGKFTVARFGAGYHPGMAAAINPMAASALGYSTMMGSAMMGTYGNMAMGGYPMFGNMSMLGNPFMAMTMGGMANIMGMGPSGPGGAGAGMFDNTGWRGGQGYGSWNPLTMPGRINNTNPGSEYAHQAQVAGVLADPSLTVEDKVTLLIMLIMNKMDDDIERQAQYINSLQQQQSSRTPGGDQGAGGGAFGLSGGPFNPQGGGENSPSIDVETMKLKRMIDKRSQMFDMLRQIIDKYNETAKNIIQSIGR
ncbi:MAG: hypothetical protein RMA76_11275 [Deltaproteobacteria bacterium]|jgi:hypothetical protein